MKKNTVGLALVLLSAMVVPAFAQTATSLRLAEQVFDAKSHNIRELMVALTATDAFRLHAVKAGEPAGSLHPHNVHLSRPITRRRATAGGAQ